VVRDKKQYLCNKLFLKTGEKTVQNIKGKKMFIKKLKIGNVELENNIILAPMAGVTDLPFRTICKQFGPRISVYRNGE